MFRVWGQVRVGWVAGGGDFQVKGFRMGSELVRVDGLNMQKDYDDWGILWVRGIRAEVKDSWCKFLLDVSDSRCQNALKFILLGLTAFCGRFRDGLDGFCKPE